MLGLFGGGGGVLGRFAGPCWALLGPAKAY